MMKDLITPFLPTEHGVMSSWFFCTVCRNVLNGRTTCGRNARKDPQEAEGAQDLVQPH